MIRIKSTLVLFSLLLFSLSSCINNVDLDQAKDLDFQAPVRMSLINLELSQANFFDETNAVVPLISDESEIHLSEIISHSETKSIVIDTYCSNTFDTDITLLLEYYNGDDEQLSLTHQIEIGVNELDSHHEIIIEETDFDEFLLAKKIRVSVMLDDPSQVFPLLNSEFIMRSSLSVMYKY
jgi:hypothetical protein